MKQRGILTIAGGDPNWGKYAYNLAMSIRATEPEMKISVAHAGSALGHLAPHMRMAFDEIIQIPEHMIYKGGHQEFLKAKMFMYELSPYRETIFLDADTIWLPKQKPTDVFERIEEDLLFQCRGKVKITDDVKTLWSHTKAIRTAYKFKSGFYHNISSEFVYFKKTKANGSFFKLAQREYDNLKVPAAPFGGATPDELPFSIALLKKEIDHKGEFHPIYWELEQKRLLEPARMHSEFVAYSMGGNNQNGEMHRFYNNLVKYYGRVWGETALFLWQNKQLWQPMRTNV